MRDLHSLFLGAVLGGEGLQGVADLASVEAGGPVAIVLPARGLTASSPEGLEVNGPGVEVDVADARDEVQHDLRASLIEDLREGRAEGGDVVRRAARLGCELTRGALGLVAEIRSRKPRGAAALIA